MDRVFRVGDFPNTFAQQGWQCPICGRVYSPTTAMCFYCGNYKTVMSTGIRIDYPSDQEKTSGIDYTRVKYGDSKMKDWKEIVKNSERYKGFEILDTPMSFKEFATDHGDIDLVQIHSTEMMNGYDDIIGFVGQCRWRNNRLTPLDGDTYNEDMTVLGYNWFYPMDDTLLLSGECLDILVGDDW